MLPSPEVVRAEGWKAAQGSGRHESTPLVLPSAPSLFLPSIHPPLQTFPEAQRKTSEQKILQRKGLCREKHPTPPRMSFPLPRSPSGWEPEEAEPLLSRTLNFRRETPPSEWHRTGPTGRFKRSRPQVRIRGHGKPFPRKQGIISALLVLCGLIFLGGELLPPWCRVVVLSIFLSSSIASTSSIGRDPRKHLSG